MAIRESDLVEDPDVFPTFHAYHEFLSRQAAFSKILHSPLVILNLEDGREIRLQPAGSRAIGSLPARFWVLNFIGIISCLLGVGIFSVRVNVRPAQVYAIAGLGLLLGTMSVAVIASREIALEPDFLERLRVTYHLGNDIYALFAIYLLALYPSPLKSLFLPRFVAFLMLLFLGNQYFEWTDLPGNTTLIQAPIYMVIALLIGFFQWRNAKRSIVDQAAFKWFILAFLVPTGMGCFLYFVLLIIHGHTVFSISVGLSCFLFMHVSLALGIIKYRLFDIDRWWFNLWLWFFAGIFVLAFDALLIFLMDLSRGMSLSLSLLFVGWAYFPVRQWILGRIYRKYKNRFQHYLPILVAGIVGQEKQGVALWEYVLKEIFEPLSLQTISDKISTAKILQYGQTLQVPDINGNGAIELMFPDKGGRLFSSLDIRLVEELYKISRQTESRLAAHTRGVQEERERILRDLHDDIGGKLLSLAQTSGSRRSTQLAQEALGALRDIVYSLDPEASMAIDAALADWRQNFAERCESADVGFDWQVELYESKYLLNPRQLTNLSRVLSEAVTNAFRHAEPDLIRIHWSLDGQRLRASIFNNGVASDHNDINLGKGLNNMQRRLTDLGGTFEYFMRSEEHSFELQLVLPLSPDDWKARQI